MFFLTDPALISSPEIFSGFMLFYRLKKVRSEEASSEMKKVFDSLFWNTIWDFFFLKSKKSHDSGIILLHAGWWSSSCMRCVFYIKCFGGSSYRYSCKS